MPLELPNDEVLKEQLRELKKEYHRKKRHVIETWLALRGFATLEEAVVEYKNHHQHHQTPPQNQQTQLSSQQPQPSAPPPPDNNNEPAFSDSPPPSRPSSSSSTMNDMHRQHFSAMGWGEQMQFLSSILLAQRDDIIPRVLSWFVKMWNENEPPPLAVRKQFEEGELVVVRLLLSRLGGVKDNILSLHLQTLSLLSTSKTAQDIVAREGGVMVLFGAMIQCHDTPSVQQQAALALANLSVSEEHAHVIGREGGILLLLGAMKRHASDAVLVANVCAALGNLSLIEENKTMIAQEGGVQLVLSAMTQHPGMRHLHEQALVVLANLSVNATIAHSIIVNGGWEATMTSLEDCVADASVCALACAVVAHLSLADDVVPKVDDNSIRAIFSVMSAHPSNDTVLTHATGALGNLAKKAPVKEMIVALGGVEVILRAIQVLPLSERFLATASSLLASLAVSESGCSSLSQSVKTLPLVVKIMTNHVTHPKIASSIIRCVSLMTKNENGRKLIATGSLGKSAASSATANTPLTRAMTQANPATLVSDLVSLIFQFLQLLSGEDLRSFENAMKILATVADLNDESPLCSESNMSIILDLARKNISRSNLVSSLVTFLEPLSKRPVLSSIARELVEIVSSGVKTNIDPPPLHRALLSTLVNLILKNDISPPSRSIAATLVSALRQHVSDLGPNMSHAANDANDVDLVRRGLKAIGKLSLDVNCSREMSNNGAIVLVLDVLGEGSSSLVATACATLGSLSLSGESAEAILKEKSPQKLIIALSAAPNDSEIQANGFATLWSILSTVGPEALPPPSLVVVGKMAANAVNLHRTNARVVEMCSGVLEILEPWLSGVEELQSALALCKLQRK